MRMLLVGALVMVSWAALAAQESVGDVYPLDTCPVTGAKLGQMGEPVVYDYQGREIRFCCSGCPPTFEKKPAEFLKKIDAAIVDQQKALYPLDTCVVLGDKLGDKRVDYVYRNRLVRFCCKDCIATFEKDPAKYLAKIDAAVIAKQKPAYPTDTCVVSGKKLDDGAVDYVSGNRLVRLCSKGCIEAFRKDPLKYLAKLDDAAKAKSK